MCISRVQPSPDRGELSRIRALCYASSSEIGSALNLVWGFGGRKHDCVARIYCSVDVGRSIAWMQPRRWIACANDLGDGERSNCPRRPTDDYSATAHHGGAFAITSK